MYKTCMKGSSHELQCAAYLIDMGFVVSVPYGNSARYDLVVDNGKRLFRLQCKKARQLENGNWSISTCSSHHSGHRVVTLVYSKDEIDFFCTLINGKLYLVGQNLCENKQCITLYGTKVQKAGKYLFLEDCEVEKVMTVETISPPEKRKVEKASRVTKIRKPRVIHQPSKEEFCKAIQECSIANAAIRLHVSRKRIFEIAKGFGIELKHGRDEERLRQRGVRERVAAKLRRHYEETPHTLSKSVLQYTKEGKFVAEYPSCRIAGKTLGIQVWQIRRACNKERKTYKGFVWQYK